MWSYKRTVDNYTIRTTSTNGRITLRYAVRMYPFLVLNQRNDFATLAGE